MSHRVPEEHKFCMVAEHQETCQEVRTCSSVDVSFVFRLALPIDMLCLTAHFSFSFLHFLISYFLFPHFLISHSLFYNNPAQWWHSENERGLSVDGRSLTGNKATGCLRIADLLHMQVRLSGDIIIDDGF